MRYAGAELLLEHAHHVRQAVRRHRMNVAGVTCRGRLLVHTDGARAEHLERLAYELKLTLGFPVEVLPAAVARHADARSDLSSLTPLPCPTGCC